MSARFSGANLGGTTGIQWYIVQNDVDDKEAKKVNLKINEELDFKKTYPIIKIVFL